MLKASNHSCRANPQRHRPSQIGGSSREDQGDKLLGFAGVYIYIYVNPANPKQPFFNGCLVISQPFFYVKIWNHHPVETTIGFAGIS